jgi:uncharacterized membrane protein YdjX (TVP38/TMEM64 family)
MKKSARLTVIVIAILIIITAGLCALFWPFFSRLGLAEYREAFSDWIKALGFRGILILLGLQVLQIIVAIIPGGPVEILAGAAYGVLGGLAICILGCLFASTAIFLAVRKFGAPLVIRFFGKKLTDTYAFLADTKKLSLAIFLLFLIPGLPKDTLAYIAPLSKIRLSRFIILSNFARIPAILASAMLGDSMVKGNWILVVVFFLIIAAAGILGVLYGEKFFGRLRGKSL